LEHFGLSNVHLVEGEAPAVCSEFPPADAILIGGSGGNLEEILKFAARQLRPGGTLVVTAVTPDTFSTAWQSLGETDWEQREAVLASMAHVSPRGRAQIWQGENPAFIIRAVRKQ
jgi:precorrin-6B methylase 2